MLTPEQIADGWIAHDGGPCPVPLNSRPRLLLRNGVNFCPRKNRRWKWGRKTLLSDIIAYRPETPNG